MEETLKEDILDDKVFAPLLARVRAAEFLAIIAAPPCSTFSIARFITAKDGRGAPRVRTRQHIRGLPRVSPKHLKELRNANAIVARTVSILSAAHSVGTQWILENPADRGDQSRPELWLHDEHGPIWEMPEMKALQRICGARLVTFPMCAFSAPWQKYTSLLYSAGFEAWLEPLDRLRCTHSTHAEAAGGLNDSGEWASGRAAAYPADFNLYLARATSALITSVSASSPLIRDSHVPTSDDIEVRATELQLPKPKGGAPIPTPAAPIAGGAPSVAHRMPPDGSPRRLDFSVDDSVTAPSPPPEEANPKRPERSKKVHFQRELGAYPTRDRRPVQERTTAHRLGQIGSSFQAMHAKPSCADPKNRREALNQDSEGWQASERKEIANHLANKSFEVIDRSQVPAAWTQTGKVDMGVQMEA